ncbi:TIGR02679 family protein [Niallia oryzisoli]|uniref:TIGR02679 family protein n=1 Tax=Niallia oryzisoli TaxID=1737571 RepID=UPI0037357EE7
MNPKIQLFRTEPGFLKLFTQFKEKYRSLGRIGGTVSLKSFSQIEVESIAGFLGQHSDKLLQKGSISLLEFEKELTHTGFSDYSLFQLLEEVLGETILSKKEEVGRRQTEEDSFIESLLQAIPDGEWWLDWIRKKSADTRWFWTYYQENKWDLFEKVTVTLKAFHSLPNEGEFERLPFFAQRITGNPHYFDHNEATEKLLLHCMYVDQVRKGNTEAAIPKSMEELNELLNEYGLLRDDLWNFVTCQGLLASKGNEEHPVWQSAVETKTVLNVPIKELAKVDRIWPAIGEKVWIVENSSVCSTIMDAIPEAPLICTHGQLRAASWELLDRLVHSNCTLFYSGDIDPEGVLIADRMQRRYKNHTILWRMDIEAYETSLSNMDISDRLGKLDRISTPEWTALIKLMKKTKKAGYQEALISSLISDIRRELE